jgi:hypothetical protein
MDRALLEKALAAADQHVADGELHIIKQRECVVRLESRGADTSMAKDVLDTFEQSQRLHIADRDYILRALAALNEGSLMSAKRIGKRSGG